MIIPVGRSSPSDRSCSCMLINDLSEIKIQKRSYSFKIKYKVLSIRSPIRSPAWGAGLEPAAYYRPPPCPSPKIHKDIKNQQNNLMIICHYVFMYPYLSRVTRCPLGRRVDDRDLLGFVEKLIGLAPPFLPLSGIVSRIHSPVAPGRKIRRRKVLQPQAASSLHTIR